MMRKLLAGGVVLGVGAVLFGVAALGRSSDANAVGPFPTVGTGPQIVVGAPSLVNPTTVQFTVSTVAGPTPADPMSGWNLDLRWDPAVFSFASATSQLAPGVSGGFPAPTTTLTGGVVLGMVGFSPYTALGLMTTVQLTVVAPGCSAIHLFTYGPPDNGGGTSALPADSGSFTIAGDATGPQANQGYVDGAANNVGQTCSPPPPATPTSVATATFTATATRTATMTSTATATRTATPAATDTPAPTATFTAVPTATFTAVPTSTFTAVPTATFTAVPTSTFTAVPTATFTAVPTATFTAVPTATFTAVPTATFTAVPTSTFTAVPPTSTPCGEGGCPTPTQTRVVIIVSTATPTSTVAPPTATPAAPTSTGTAVSTVLAAQATQAPPMGGAGAGVRAPNTGNGGVPGGSAQGPWWFAAALIALGAAGLSGLSLGLRKRRR